MAARTFGAALGELINARRKAKGLTQTQLAEDAYGTSGKTRRISELESGLVANPHPKTIDPLISVLGISDDDIEQCARVTHSGPDGDLDRAYREARNMIEAVARQFENDNPSASLIELDDFLREKAREWVELRNRIRALDEPDYRLSNLRASAEAALSQGLFDEVDALLMEAEDVQQQSRTLKEVSHQANLRVLRASTSLLKGDEERAVELYLSAANFFMPFDKAEGITFLQHLAEQLYESGRRSLTKTFIAGARLLEAALKMDVVSADRLERSIIGYRLSLLYRSAAERVEAADAIPFLESAIKYARISLADLNESDRPFQVTASKISLGNCLFDLVKRTRDDSVLAEATCMLKSARDQLLEEGAEPELLATVHNSVGSALMQSLNYSSIEDEGSTLKEAIASFKAAIAAAEEYEDPGVWGAANNNLGNALAGIANLEGRDAGSGNFLRVRAISAVLASIETYPEVQFPLRFAEAHISLARIFWDMAAHAEEQIVEPFLIRSISSWTVAQEIYRKDQFPQQWADIQVRMGAIYGAHAALEGVKTAEQDLLEARRHFVEALEILKSPDERQQIDYCNNCLKTIENRLREIKRAGESKKA
jgi:transcriptional regulator with XRE-family HTH domain